MVIARPALSIACGFTLALSLFFKLPGLMGLAAATPGAIPQEIAALLERRGFQVRQDTDSSDRNLIWISGRAGACDVLIATVALQGWHRSLMAQRAVDHRLFYTFNGNIYAEQPIVRTRAHHYWVKLNRYLGLEAQTHPLLAVIAAPTCTSVPLEELAALSGHEA